MVLDQFLAELPDFLALALLRRHPAHLHFRQADLGRFLQERLFLVAQIRRAGLAGLRHRDRAAGASAHGFITLVMRASDENERGHRCNNYR